MMTSIAPSLIRYFGLFAFGLLAFPSLQWALVFIVGGMFPSLWFYLCWFSGLRGRHGLCLAAHCMSLFLAVAFFYSLSLYLSIRGVFFFATSVKMFFPLVFLLGGICHIWLDILSTRFPVPVMWPSEVAGEEIPHLAVMRSDSLCAGSTLGNVMAEAGTLALLTACTLVGRVF